MKTVQDIVLELDRAMLRDELQVGDTAISNAVSRNVFPAKWFDVVEKMCASKEIECPRSLFAFVGNRGTAA